VSRERYVADQPPLNHRDLIEWLSREMPRIENAFAQLFPHYETQFVDQTAVASTADIILADASQTAVVVYLPAAELSKGDQYRIIKRKGGNNVVVRSTDTINGGGSATLSTQYQSSLFLCDGIEWFEL
jgi:hypothetical protein